MSNPLRIFVPVKRVVDYGKSIETREKPDGTLTLLFF